MRCTPCSSTGSPTTPHVSSSRRRRLGLDISWDVSVVDGWRESSRTPRCVPAPRPGRAPGRGASVRYSITWSAPFPSGRLIVLTTRVLRASSRLRGVRGARHTGVVLIDEQPATGGLDPRLAVPLHHRAHPPVLVDECLIGITVDHDDVAFLIDAVRDLAAQFLARRIVLEQIGKERAKRPLSIDPESCASYCGYHVVGNVCQEY